MIIARSLMLVMGTDNWKFHTKNDKKFEKKQEKKYLPRAGFEPGSSCIVPGLPAKCVPIPITHCYRVKGQKRSASPLSCWSTWVQKHCSCSWRRTHRLCRSFFPKKVSNLAFSTDIKKLIQKGRAATGTKYLFHWY